MKPPPRLLDDPSVAPELRADLKRAATSLPAYNAVAGLASLQAAIGSSLGAPTGAAAHAAQAKTATTVSAGKSATLLGSTGAKIALLGLGSAALVAVGTLGSLTTTRDAAPQRHPAPHAAAPIQPAPTSLPEPTALPPALQAPAVPAPTAEVSVPAPDARHARARVHTPTMQRTTRRSDPDAALRLEVAQLGRIKSVLDSDPAQAYRLAEAGHKTFRRGMLRPEREALATLALWNLGRRDEATRRAEAFLMRYPTSPLRARLQQLVENR